jgi:glutathione S-transferase
MSESGNIAEYLEATYGEGGPMAGEAGTARADGGD